MNPCCIGIWLILSLFVFAFLYLASVGIHRLLGKEAPSSSRTFLWIFSLLFSLIIVVLIAIPEYVSRKEHHCANAKLAGRIAQMAEDSYYNDRGEDVERRYTTELNRLLTFDKTLTDDANVTFVFLHASNSGFAFYTQHARCKPVKRYYFTEQDSWTRYLGKKIQDAP